MSFVNKDQFEQVIKHPDGHGHVDAEVAFTLLAWSRIRAAAFQGHPAQVLQLR